jgi:hypothetical protein
LPNLIAWWATGKKKFISRALLVLQTDIQIFSGFCFIIFSIVKKMKLSDNFILIFSFIMNVAALPIHKIMKTPESFLLRQILGYFVLTDTEAYFPLCSYFFFVAFGYWFGGIYQKISNKDKFYNLIFIFFLPITFFYCYLRIQNYFPMLPEFGSD